MAPVAVAIDIEHHRALALAAQLGGPHDRLAHGEHVHAVDDLGMHVVVRKTRGAPRHAFDAHHLIVAPAGHAVMVVADQENHREPALEAVGQVVGELGLRCEVQGFEHHPVRVGAVAGETAHHVAPFEIAVGQRRARRNGDAAADDGVGAEVADREVGDVHRAPTPAAVAVVLAEQLADGAIDMLLQGGFEQVFVPGRGAVGHPPPQLFDGHLAERHRAFGETFTVAAVRARDVVRQLQRRAGPRRCPFLADRYMRRPAVVEITDRLVGPGAQFHDHLLELPDDQHVLEDGGGLVAGDRARGQFRAQVLVVAIGGDPAAIHLERLELRSHIAQVNG